MKIIPASKHHNGKNITDTTACRSVFCCDHNMQEIKLANSGETFFINTKIIKKNRYDQMDFLAKLRNWLGKP